MTVYIAGYKGTETDDILGVFVDYEEAKTVIHNDYKNTEFGYTPDIEEIDDDRIYISKMGEWFDEWYVIETELYK